ncbi:MBL fold metallo-hydrolase [Chryseobacterium flavum]|uniref:MBL fold metallo-hydrolase n=1 Tax=Chryseobacterium flavum TaxID=415851 RepID=UPI0028AEE1BE|nr:MBL fold metallo-hydrolase [Chryseobacterium flavum]
MKRIFHLNCVKIVIPINDNVIGHCLLIEENNGDLILIDTGIGVQDIESPDKRLGEELIKAVGFQLDMELTALNQIRQLGLDPGRVKHCILSHLDPDHTGGIADFPQAKVHVAKEEYQNFESGNPRYLKEHLAHHPEILEYSSSDEQWFGLEARRIHTQLETEILLIPLFGHTFGHCGIAFQRNEKWIFYTGDAYYLRLELEDEQHPVNQLAAARADDNTKRLESIRKIKTLMKDHPEIETFGYHDAKEFSKFITENQSV